MIEIATQFARKMIFKVICTPHSTSNLSAMDIILGLLYESLRTIYAISPDWPAFLRGGQFESPDGMSKTQVATYIPRDQSEEAVLWAMRVRARDPITRRRSWILQVGIKGITPDTLEFYYANSYNDHLAGSLSDIKPPIIQDDRFLQPLFECDQIRCMIGTHPLPASAVELRHTTLPEMMEILHDEKRTIPLILISCPDLISPNSLYTLTRGNLFVYWCEDTSVITRLNELLPQIMYVEWDSLHVFLPFEDNSPQRQPSFPASEIEQAGGNEILLRLYRAYCQGLRSEERRAFVSIEDIKRLQETRYLSGLTERLKKSDESIKRLSNQLEQREKERISLQASYDALSTKKDQSDAADYESLLTESLAETDALKSEISALTTRLYSDLGKSFKAEDHFTSPHIQELAHAIYACLARANERKGS